MSDKKSIDEQELLKCLESDRNKDINGSKGSSSLDRIIEEDIKNNLPPTKLIPLILTITGGLYLGIVQIYNFTSSLDNVHDVADDNRENIRFLSDEVYSMRLDLSSLINENNTLTLERINRLDNEIANFSNQREYILSNTLERLSRIEDSIENVNRKYENEVRDLKTTTNELSSEVSNIESEIRVLRREMDFLTR